MARRIYGIMPQEILVVEDEPAVAEMIRFGLEGVGYKIVLAANGQEALSLAGERNPDLIISDILMPVMDGYALYKELKKNPATARIPVLILTARGKMEDSFRVMGVDDFIVKPLDVDVLLSKIESYFKKAAPPKVKNVLVIGGTSTMMQSMAAQLQQRGCVVDMTIYESEVLMKAMKLRPAIIFIEAATAHASAEEMVRTLRRFSQFNDAKILIYSYLSAKDRQDKFNYLKISKINDVSQKCLEAGANEYIGHTSDPLFTEAINKYLNY